MDNTHPKHPSWQLPALFVISVLFLITLLIIAICIDEPKPFPLLVFRVVLSLAAAGFGAILPGFIRVNIPKYIIAGGALGIFAITYFFNPPALILYDKAQGIVQGITIPPITEKPSKNVAEILDKFSRSIEILENSGVSLNAEDYFKRGNDFYYKERYEDAFKAYDTAIELKPDYAEAWYNKGYALDELERYKEALTAYDAAIELMPDYADAWFNRALAYSLKQDKESALENLKKAIELDDTLKDNAKKDKDFKDLWDDPAFKKLVE